MYRRKSVGPRMEPWGTPALTVFWRRPIQNHLKPSITEKRKNKAKYLTWTSLNLKFVKNSRIPNPVKSYGYIKCYISSGPRPVLRFAVDREDLQPYWKSEKRPYFSRWSTILLFTSFSKILLTTKRRLKQQ